MSVASLCSRLLISFYALQPTVSTSTSMETASTTQLVLTYCLREPRVQTATRRAVILLHGVGSNERDVFSLADHLPDDFYVIAARGPFTLGPGRYAWYNVDFSSGRPVYDTKQEAVSRDHIARFIAEMKRTYHLDTVYLSGFSQGAIMSYSIGLTQPQLVKGILALSGRVLEEIKPTVADPSALAGLNVFIAHGTQDNTLPIAYARSAKNYLDNLHIRVSYHEYVMGHTINESVLKDIVFWLTHPERG